MIASHRSIRLTALFVSGLFTLAGVLDGAETANPSKPPRARVIVDNDFGGDPDGLFQLAHQLLSPSVEVRGIIGSHHHAGGFFNYPGTAEHACKMADELLAVMDLKGKVPLLAGAEGRLGDAQAPDPTEAARLIVREAMRVYTQLDVRLMFEDFYAKVGLSDTRAE